MKKLIKKGQAGLKTSYGVSPTNIAKAQIGQFQYGVPGLGTIDDYSKRNGKKSLPTESIRYHPTDNEIASNNRTMQIGNSIGDFGSRLLNGVGTYGGSIIGDTVNSFSPNTAQQISNLTNGAISPTSQEYLDSNKNWSGRINNAVGSFNNVFGAEIGGAVGGKVLGAAVETPFVKNLTSKVGNMLPKFLSTTKTAATPVSLVKKNTTMLQSVKNGTTSVLKNSAKETIKAPIQNYMFENN